MVKSGSFKVSQGDLGGRIGAGLGKGLAEAIPKEVDQYRLSQGLKNFAKNAANMNPLEAFAEAGSIKGIPPQLLQALPELVRLQQQRQAYGNLGGQGVPQSEPTQMQTGGISAQGNVPRNIQEPRQELVQPGERGQPAIQETNPLRPEATPALRWNQRRFDQEVGRALQEGKVQTIPEAINYAKEKEERERSEPKAQQEQDAYFRQQQDLSDSAIDKKLRNKIGVDQSGNLKGLTGETLNNLQRQMYKDLRTSGPDVSIEDVSEYWAEKGNDLVKAKDILSEQENKSFINKLTRGAENLEKLKSQQKIFAETGNEEEYYNILRGKNFNLSPQGAAAIAYPLSSPIKQYVQKVKPTKTSDVSFTPAKSRKYAVEVANIITPNDSLLAIARDLRQKDPGFNQRAFFNQLREDQDTLGLSPRQKRELPQGESDIMLNWGDLLYFPLFRD